MPPDSAFKVLQLYFSDSPACLVRSLNHEHTNMFLSIKSDKVPFYIGMLDIPFLR